MPECEHCSGDVPLDSEACPHCGQLHVPQPDELLGTEILGRYKLAKLIAEGGMGRVYLAEQAVGTATRRVAVKVLRKQLGRDKQVMGRFAREAETLVRLTHPNTVQLFDFGALPDGTLALAMEYVQGHSLAREIHQQGALPVARVERMLTQICGALQEAHAHGIVHRDLKPDNLLITDRIGQDDFVKVLDFGIAKVADDGDRKNTKLTQQGMIIGTPPYMSPEQFSGEAIDARSDIYSLGVIAFEMLSGKLPFAANTPWEWASRHLTAPPESLRPDTTRGLSAAHARAIDAALAKRVEDRPQSVQAFLALFTAREGAAADTQPLLRSEAPASVRAVPPSTGSELAAPSARTNSSGADDDGTEALLRPPLSSRGGKWLIAAGLVTSVAVGAWASLRAGPSGPAPSPAALPSPVASAPREDQPPPLPVGVSPPEDAPAQANKPSGRDEGSHHRRRERSAEARGAGESASAELAPAKEPADATRAPAKEPADATRAPAREPADATRAPAKEPADATHAAARGPAGGDVAAPVRNNAPVATADARPDSAASARGSTTTSAPARSAAPEGARASVSRDSAHPSATGAAVPADLQQRIAQIQAAASSRPEVALGLYQAALGRYGAHPSLSNLRASLSSAGEARVGALLAQGRCAQAQALQRALRGALASQPPAGLFGSRCPAP